VMFLAMMSARSPWRSERTALRTSSMGVSAGEGAGFFCCAAVQAIAETVNRQTATANTTLLRTVWPPDAMRDRVDARLQMRERGDASTPRAASLARRPAPEVIEPAHFEERRGAVGRRRRRALPPPRRRRRCCFRVIVSTRTDGAYRLNRDRSISHEATKARRSTCAFRVFAPSWQPLAVLIHRRQATSASGRRDRR